MSLIPPTSSGTSQQTPVSSSVPVDNTEIASNFTTFLQLLTTQLKNQDPLDPLDTNQFTQQLVQFAQVEQQMKQNDQLGTLISLDKSAQSTVALTYVGQTVVVDGSTSQLSSTHKASWLLNVAKPATTTVTITDSTGQTVYSGSFAMNPGDQTFVWDGTDSSGKTWPPGTYKLATTAVDASGQTVAVTTQTQGVVDSVDLTQDPPTLSIGGQDYGMNQIKKVVRSGA
jgi:flagellar basal-body rod modification protein FlgD